MPDTTALAVRGPAQAGPRVAVVAGLLASAGVPLYIHLPRFASELGLSLGVIGLMLLGLRVMDFVQDPLLGWLAQRLPERRPQLAAAALLVLGAGFCAIYTLQPGLIGLVLVLVAVFTAYSLGTILFYAQCAAIADPGGDAAHYRIAGWREAGALAGIVTAAILPGALGSVFGSLAGYAAFGALLALAAPLVLLASTPIWTVPTAPVPAQFDPQSFLSAGAGRLLVLALLNAMPVAVTSTLFLFFVEDRLGLPELAGPYLVLFFLSAGASAPLWSRLAARFGARPVLLPAMAMAVLAFAGTAILPVGAAWAFGAITIVSGAAIGADLVILPALFAATLARARLPQAIGFGAWSFATKASLAIAAGTVLPLLQLAGYAPGGTNDADALGALNAAYAILPLLLKLPAMILVARLPEDHIDV